MSEIAEEERRRDLLKKVEALSTEEIERLVAGHVTVDTYRRGP